MFKHGEVISRLPDIPDDFEPEDVISREMDVQEYISALKAEGIYNRLTGVWTLHLGEKCYDSYYRPSLTIEPNKDPDGNFSPDVTYISGDGKFSIRLSNIRMVESLSSRDTMEIMGIVDSCMIRLEVTSTGYASVSMYTDR